MSSGARVVLCLYSDADVAAMMSESARHGGEDLYIMRADGSEQIRITDAPGYDGQAQWTSGVSVPAGSTDLRTDIAFVSDRDRDREIYLA